MPRFVAQVAIDGTPRALLLEAEDLEAARAQLSAAYRAGEMVTYQQADGGELLVRWAKVATVEPGPIQPA